MVIDLVTVEKSWTVEHPSGSVQIERGQVLMGEIITDIFLYPLTIGNMRVECHEHFDNKRILPVLEGLKLS